MTRSVLGATAATESSRQRERKPLTTTLHESNCHIVPNAPVSTPESRKSHYRFAFLGVLEVPLIGISGHRSARRGGCQTLSPSSSGRALHRTDADLSEAWPRAF